jgi:hypothetical protein
LAPSQEGPEQVSKRRAASFIVELRIGQGRLRSNVESSPDAADDAQATTFCITVNLIPGSSDGSSDEREGDKTVHGSPLFGAPPCFRV